MLPGPLRDAIDPLYDYLRAKRSKALTDVIRGLDSKQYVQILQDWEAFLNEPSKHSPSAFNAALPIINLARKRIYKKYRNMVESGHLILENTRDEMLHDLRIECKKLRYLMEFFSSLFPRRKITVLINQLRKLQDNLGDFQDLCVQEAYLQNITEELPINDQQFRKAILAIGSLIRTLSQEQQTVKDAFSKIFTDFASPSNEKLFHKLFASEKREVVA